MTRCNRECDQGRRCTCVPDSENHPPRWMVADHLALVCLVVTIVAVLVATAVFFGART